MIYYDKLELVHTIYACLEGVFTELKRQNEQSFICQNEQTPKYRIGQIVWRLDHNDYSPLQCVIADINHDLEETYFLDDHGSCAESELFSNRQELINFHVDYWNTMMAETGDER